MKKVLIAATILVGAMAVQAMAANKLVVKNAGGSADVMVMTDGGKLGVNAPVPLYPVDVATVGAVSSSALHFMSTGADSGGWLTAVGGNNFFISSGAVYDNGQWIQKDASGKSVFFGSGAVGFRAFLNQGNAVGVAHTSQLQAMLLDYAGNMELAGQLRLNVNTTPAAQPACDATKRGYLWFTQSATGVKDALQVCAKDASNAYAWRTLY
jgi:hypothetical protein